MRSLACNYRIEQICWPLESYQWYAAHGHAIRAERQTLCMRLDSISPGSVNALSPIQVGRSLLCFEPMAGKSQALTDVHHSPRRRRSTDADRHAITTTTNHLSNSHGEGSTYDHRQQGTGCMLGFEDHGVSPSSAVKRPPPAPFSASLETAVFRISASLVRDQTYSSPSRASWNPKSISRREPIPAEPIKPINGLD